MITPKVSFMKKPIVQNLLKYFLLITLVLVAVVFGILQPAFYNLNNIMDILRTASVIGIMALGCMLIMSTGELNWCMGAQFTMAAGIVGRLMANAPEGAYVPVIILSLILTMFTGLLTGFFVIQVGVPSFIASLAMETVMTGVNKLLCDGGTFFSPAWGDYFTAVGRGYLFDVIPLPVIAMLILAVISHFFYEKTATGRHLCAVGANETASRQVGLNTGMLKYLAFALSALLCGVAGIIQSSISMNVSLSAGSELLMPALCTTMLGATFLKPGKYNVPGTAVAAILMILIQNGVVSAGGSFYVKNLIQGAICIVAVGIVAMVRTEGLPKVSFGN